MTKKERREVYIKAIERVNNKNLLGCERYICIAIADICKINVHDVTPESFPELFIFEQVEKNWNGWFGSVVIEENQKLREIVLLFCAEMCK